MNPLVEQLLIGSGMIAGTLVLQVVFVAVAIRVLDRFGGWISGPPVIVKISVALTCLVLWLVLGISISTWAWALMFLYVDALTLLEESLYFATVTFTTLGYGDIVLSQSARLLASMCAVNGLIVFGLNTAFLIEFIVRLRASEGS